VVATDGIGALGSRGATLLVMDPRSEPYARKPLVRFCAGATSDGRRYRNTYCLRQKVSPKKSPGFQLGRCGFCAISYPTRKSTCMNSTAACKSSGWFISSEGE